MGSLQGPPALLTSEAFLQLWAQGTEYGVFTGTASTSNLRACSPLALTICAENFESGNIYLLIDQWKPFLLILGFL